MTLVAAVVLGLLNVLAQISVTVTSPGTVGPRDPLLVKVEVTAPAGREVRVLAPSFAPFRVMTSTSVVAVDSAAQRRAGALRAVWQSVEYRYVLSPPAGASGRFSFGPFEAQVSAPGLRPASARSRPWTVAVRPPPNPAGGGVPEIVERANITPGSGINFHALVVPETVYVGQQASYQVGVFLDEGVRTRLRRNPEFLPPELRAMLAYELPAGRASLRDRLIAGKRWDVHVFQRAVFPLSAGRTDVPPAQLSYSLPLSLGFFSREESYTARSEPATVIAIPPPTTGRPSDWVGAVGVLHASSRIDTASARVGDPVVVTLRVEGTGNVKLLPRPALSLGWATAVAGDERVEVDSSALLVRGAKEFDWIVTPRASGDRELPAIRYPYFDPYQHRYELATSEPIPVTVAPGALADADQPTARPTLAIRPTNRGNLRAPLPSSPLFWLLVALAPIPAIVVVARRRPKRVRAALPSSTQLRETTRAASTDVRRVRRLFAQSLADRLALRASASHVASARAGAVARRLRRCGVTPETAADVERMLRSLDTASYAAQAPDDTRALANDAWAVYARVDAEARAASALRADTRRTLAAFGIAAMVASISAGGVVLHAAQTNDARAAFASGVAAYERGHFADAHRAFVASAIDEPRAADAWANAGTAAWAASDTVGAAVGWQRALRLEPRAPDMRDRVAMLPTTQDGWIAAVPPLPLDWVAGAGIAAWLIGCASLVVGIRRGLRGSPWSRVAGLAFVCAAGATVVGAQIVRVADARDLAVVRLDGPLRVEPALGAENGPPVQATDVARIGSRQSVWAHVALDGGRSGWIESDRLIPLGDTR